MAGKRGRRKVVLVLAAVGVGVWVVRSRTNAVPEAWLPPLPQSDPNAQPRHAAATPDEATMDPAPTGDAPKHAAPATTSNGAGPSAGGSTSTTASTTAPITAPVAKPSSASAPAPSAKVSPKPSPRPVVEPAAPAVPAAAPAVAGVAAAEPDPAPAEEPASSGSVSTAGAMTGGTPSPLFAEPKPQTATTHGAPPLADGSAPGPEYVIKGNADSMLFHSQSSPYFGRTRAEVWFRTEEEALAAGFAKWSRRKSG